MKDYLDIFERTARRVRPALRAHQLEVAAGSWLGSSALKVQKRRWTERPFEAGIFFSVWAEEKGLKQNRAFYNIHALRLRSMRAYSLQSREFAMAFRDQFARGSGAWPNVSVNYGPQTLMQGWITLDETRLEPDAAGLVHRFIPLAKIIDSLLDARKAA